MPDHERNELLQEVEHYKAQLRRYRTLLRQAAVVMCTDDEALGEQAGTMGLELLDVIAEIADRKLPEAEEALRQYDQRKAAKGSH